MATRRKYRTPAAPADADVAAGAPASPDDAAEIQMHAEALQREAEQHQHAAQQQPVEDNPLQRALDAQQHAEHLQQQHHAAHHAHHAAIDAMGLDAHKTAMIKKYPEMLKHGKALSVHHGNAIAGGVPDNSPQMDAFMLQALQHEQAKQGGSPQQMPATMAPPPPPAPAPRRSIPMSAPVSRDIGNMSGHREAPGFNTLTAEERIVARNSFSDPNMSPQQKELLYLRNKQRLAQLRKDGAYPASGQG